MSDSVRPHRWQPSYLGPNPVSLITLRSGRWLLLACPLPTQLVSSLSVGWWHLLDCRYCVQFGETLIHIWRPEISIICDISFLLIYQEIFHFAAIPHVYKFDHIWETFHGLLFVCFCPTVLRGSSQIK